MVPEFDVLRVMELFMAATRLILFSTLLSICIPLTSAQQLDRVKVAEGEYRITEEGDMGVGPIDTEVFHRRVRWCSRQILGDARSSLRKPGATE